MEQQEKKQLEPRQCAYADCEVVFTPKRHWQRFCCDEHKKRHHQEANDRLRAITKRYVQAYQLFAKEATDEAAIELAQARWALWDEVS